MRFPDWRKDVMAGAIATIVSLPICVASGVLAFAPLGPGYAATGAAAGLGGAIVTGIVAGIVATSSFVITSPRVSESLILASLISALSTRPAMDEHFVVVSVFFCAMLAGLWQAAFGLAGLAKVIKFTPHPVLVGFLNGIAVLIAVSQLKPFFSATRTGFNGALINRPGMLLLMIGVAGIILIYPALAKRSPKSWRLTKVPALFVGFIGGIAAFYAAKGLNPDVDLGPIVGEVTFTFPLVDFGNLETWKKLGRFAPDILPISMILAIVATMDSLLVFRTAQTVSDLRISPVRDLFAHGIANFASALAGGVTSAASPSPTMAAYRAGGRSWLVPVSSALILLALSVLFSRYLAGIPTVVLSGILLAVAVSLFDRWLIQLASDVRKGTTPLDRRRSLYDFAVVLLVMTVTVFYSVVAGVILGCLLAGIIFVMNMSRPIVRRTLFGGEIQSKRLRPAKETAFLRETGSRRAVLQLEGVLFFGNADDLSTRMKPLFEKTDMITLDMRGVTDIDVSGSNILANIVGKSRELKKDLLFCHVPPACSKTISALAPKTLPTDALIKHDLDSALECMEEKALLLAAEGRSRADVLPLGDIDFLAGFEEHELGRLGEMLTRRNFAPGEVICREGDEGDRMWLLAKGSVSVRLALKSGGETMRIASLARGTTIGEMSLIDSARRSATIVADEDVVCYELLRDSFAKILREYPAIGIKLLSNLARALSQRLRLTSDDLRNRG